MKKYLNTLRMSVILIILVVFGSCGPKTGTGPGTTPPANVAPSIASLSVVNVVYDGRQNTAQTGSISVTANGYPAPTIYINGVSGSTYITPKYTDDGTYNHPITVMNGVGSPATGNAAVTVTTDPTVAMFCNKWGMDSKYVNGVLLNNPCELDDVMTFSKDNKYLLESGTNCPGAPVTLTWYFTKVGVDIILHGFGPDKKVDVTSTTLELSYTAGDGSNYRFLFTKRL